MAETPVIVVLGSSNEAGFLALLDDVLIEDMTRWVGAGELHPPIPSTSAQRPYEVRIPGIRVLTPRRPYSTNVARPIAGVAGGRGTLDYGGDQVEAFVDSWIYIRTSISGQGKLRRITAKSPEPTLGSWPFYRGALLGGGSGGGVHRLFIDESYTELLASWPFYRASLLGGGTGSDRALAESLSQDEFGSWGEVNFLLDSYTIGAVDPARTTITRTSTTAPLFTEATTLGRDVMFFADLTVRRVIAVTSDKITVDRPVAANLSGGFCILTGQNSCETMADLANPTKCSLQDLTFFLDQNAPVFLTGGDVCNYDATPFQCPRIAYEAGPTINSLPELGFQIRSELTKPLVVVQCGISASMISPFLQGSIPGQAPFAGYIGWFHDVLSLDFHPSSPSSLFTALVNEITAAKLLIQAEGNTAKFIGIFINLFDNDPVDAQRLLRIGENAEKLRDALRAHIGDDTVPFIMSGPSRYGGTAEGRRIIYDQLNAVAAQDTWSGVFDTRMDTEISGGVYVFPEDYAFDALHFSTSGQIKKARGYFSTWKALIERNAAAALPAPVDTSPTAIIARIDAAILDGVDVLSFPGNGGQITLRGFDEMMRMREKMVALAARQNRLPRKTLARFG